MPKTPGFRTIICADVAGFSNSSRIAPDQGTIRHVLYRELRAALAEANIQWEACHVEDRGDGVLIIAPAGNESHFQIERIPQVLTDRIREHNDQEPRQESKFQLRVAIHIGKVAFDDNGVISDAVITTFRMLNSQRLKTELSLSGSVLVFCTSNYLYKEVLRHTPIAKDFQSWLFRSKKAFSVVWVWPPAAKERKLTRPIAGFVIATAAVVATAILTTPPPAAPQSLLGADPRMADPCALADPGALAQFGDTELDSEYGPFSRCDVIVRSGDSAVVVKVQFWKPESMRGEPLAAAVNAGAVGVIRKPLNGKVCQRMMTLPAGYGVEASAKQHGKGQADLCGMADRMTEHAVTVLNRGQIPRRAEKPKHSLFHADACTILPLDRLSRFPGINAKDPEIGFGNWSCDWVSSTHAISLKIIFDQTERLDAADGRPITVDGRTAFVKPNGYADGACLVQTPYYALANSDRVEALFIIVRGGLTVDDHCEIAARVATN